MTHVIGDGKLIVTFDAYEANALHGLLQRTKPYNERLLELLRATGEFMTEIRREANDVEVWSDEELFEEESE